MKKGIEFADETWNPVWGCFNRCKYCYARPIAKRFGKQIAKKEILDLSDGSECHSELLENGLINFKPTFLHSQLNKKFKKKTTHVFVNSMSDIMYWNHEWWELVLKQVSKYPDKKFVFFTKDNQIWKHEQYFKLDNMMLIATINTNSQLGILDTSHSVKNFGICIEPIQEDLSSYFFKGYDWVIIGGETGNRKDKIEVQTEWIKPFYDLNIPVFMKESIRHLVPKDKFRQERI